MPDSERIFGGMPAGQLVRMWGDLCLFLGGSNGSFTGMLLYLTAKADPGNLARLREGFPREVRAWEIWHTTDPAITAEELDKRITEVNKLIRDLPYYHYRALYTQG